MNRNSKKPTAPRLRAILVDDEPLARIHLATRLKAHPEIEIVGEAGDVPGAFSLISKEKPDVIFLDIQMPKKNGFSLLPLLEKLDPQPAIVFVTAYDEYALKAFEAHALDYLTKPVSAIRLAKTILHLNKMRARATGVTMPGVAERATIESISPPTSEGGKPLEAEDLILLREKSLSMMVKVREITAIVSQGDYTQIFLSEGKILMMKQSLSSWDSQLSNELFTKVSRSLLVNRKSITKMERKNLLSWDLHLVGLKTPISLSNLECKRLREVL
jgi:two-component system LytT family response regulator